MDLLNKITIKNLLLNKRRTIVTIIGIILSVALITAVASMFSSGLNSLIELEKREKGNFHIVFYNMTPNDAQKFKENENIDGVYLSKGLGYSKIDSKNDEKPYAYITAYNTDALNNLSIKLQQGRLPKNENEILVPAHAITNGGMEYKIGDTITFDIGSRISSENDKLTQNQAYDSNKLDESIIDTTNKSYEVVGIIERPAGKIEPFSAPGYTFITYFDENNSNDVIDIYARYTKEALKNYYKATANLLNIDEELYTKFSLSEDISEAETEEISSALKNLNFEFDLNNSLIMVEASGFVTQYRSIMAIIVIICLIIVASSVFCIKNSFEISITEKIKQYGILRSIGATKKQISRNVLYEAMILATIGIPLGIFIGIGGNYLLISVSNTIIKGTLPSGFELIHDFSWESIIFAIILGVITIYLSARKSAKRAGKISPIEGIRNSANIKIKAKNLKTPIFISKLFGIGGEISYKNLKRNKKKYKTSILAIIVSVVLFVSLSSFVSQGFEIVKVAGGRISAFTVVSIFSYGFITVITLIGITNIFNTLTTSVELRKPEFAMLKSIGMTTKEFNKMIKLECLFMGVKSLFYGIPIGTVLSYILCYLLAKNINFTIKFPFTQIVIAIIAVFALILLIMTYSVKKVSKQNTIETIRNENI